MIGHDFDQRLSLNTINAEPATSQERSRGGVDVQQEILSQLSRAKDIKGVLDRLRKQDPALYAEALRSLQQAMGNSGVNRLLGGDASAGGLVNQAMDMIKQGAETAMPMRGEMEAAFGGLGDVKFMTGASVSEALDMVGAEAAAFGNVIAARGTDIAKDVLAEEIAHTRQQRDAKEGGGVASMTTPSDVFEAEAQRIAAAVAGGGRAPEVEQKSGDRVMLARRSFFSSIGRGARNVFSSIFGGGSKPPENVDLNIGGARLTIPMPRNHDENQKTVTLNTSGVRSPIPGLQLSSVVVTFDDRWRVQSGTAQASVQAGPYVSVNNASLTIGAGGQVNSVLEGIQFNVNGIVSGTMDLRLGTGGVSGRATVTHTDIRVPGGLTLSGGQLELQLQNGQITARGELTCTVDNLGAELRFQAQLNNDQVSGTLTASITEQFTIADAVTVKSGSVTGQFGPDGFEVSGNVNFQVRDWVESSFQGTYKYPSQTWDATGQLRQVQEIQFGEVAVRDMVVSASVKDSHFEGLRATGAFTVPNFEGNIDCAYDAQAQIINGTGSIRLTQEIALGGAGATLKEAGGTVTIENNALKTITGSAKAELPFDGQPTFEVSVTDGVFELEGQSLSGSGAVATLRDLQFGDPTGLRAEVKTGAGGSVTMADNQIASFETGIEFTVHDAEGQFATGNIAFNYTDQSSVNGEATFALDADYGVPDRLNGPGMLKAGSTLSVTVQAGQLQAVQLKGAKMELTNPSGDGKVEAALEGTWDFQARTLDAEGKAEFVEPWVLPTPWATVTLGAGGETGQISTKIEQNEIKKLEGSLPFECEIPFQGQNIEIAGLVKGELNAESSTVSGDIEASPKSAFSVTFADGSVLGIKPETRISAHIGESNLDQMKFALRADYDSAGTKPIKLALDIADATFEPDAGFTGIGKVSLREDYEVDVDWAEGGKITLVGGEGGGNVEASLTNNSLDWVRGQIPYKAEMKIQGADVKVQGHINGGYEDGAVSGEILANIAEETTIPVGALSGNLVLKPATTVKATIAQNSLDNIQFGLDAEYHRAGSPQLKVGVQIPNATYDASMGFSGEGQATLLEDCTFDGLLWTNGGSLTLKAGGTNLSAKITENNIESISGGILFETTIKVANEDVNIDGTIEGTYDGLEQKVSGSIDAALKNEPLLNLPGGASTLHLKNGTTLKATIGETQLQEAKFNLKADFTRQNVPFITPLKLAIDMADVGYEQASGISGKGSVKISENCDIHVPWSDGGKITLKGGEGGGGLNAELKDSALTELDGQLPFLAKLNVQNEKIDVDGNIQGKMTAGSTGAGVTGQLDAKLTSHPTLDLGSAGKIQFLPDTSIQAKIADSNLDEMSFVLKANYDVPASNVLTNGMKAKLDIPSAKFKNEGGGQFDGAGSIELREACTVRPYDGLTINLNSGSLSGEIERTKIKQAEGSLDFDASLQVFGTTSAEVEGKIQATYTGAETGGTFGGEVDAKLKSNLTIPAPQGGAEFTLIAPDTKVKATVTESALDNVQFSVVADYTQTGGILQGDGLQLRATLENATYTPEAGFNGSGELTLKSDCEMRAGDVSAKLLKEGSSVTGTVENSSLKELRGTVGFESEVPVAGQQAQVKGAVENVSYEAPNTFGGSVHATLKNELSFEAGGATLKMLPEETKVKAAFEANEFKDVKFDLRAHYDKPADATFETPLQLDAKIKDGVYDAATGLSGTGTIDLRSNCVVKAGESVKVTLKAPGTGVSAEMENNDIKQFNGNVGFESEITIDQAKGTKANVEGTINAEYSKSEGAPSFGGTFDAKVKEDFEVGSGDNLLKVKGGVTNINAKLEGSDVSEVKLNLTAEYTRTGAPFTDAGMKLEVKLADATYTKESSSIKGDGSIKLMEDAKATFGEGKADVTLKKDSGATASVAENELKSFNGGVNFEMALDAGQAEKLELGGSLDANYTKESGSVNGELNAALKKEFTIQKDAKAFKVKPEVTKMRATIANGDLGEINADLDADYIHTGAPFTESLDLNVKLTSATYKRDSGEVSGQGTLALNKPCTVEAGENKLTLKEGSNIQADVQESSLKSFTGDVGFEADVKIANATANIDGKVKADYDGDQSKFGGTFDAKVKSSFTIGEGANQLTVKKDTTNLKATLADNDLKDIIFNLDADYTRAASGALKTPLALNVKLTDATYTKESNSVSGDGSVTLMSNCELEAGEGNKLTLKEGANVKASVKDNDLASFDGNIDYTAQVKLGDQVAQVSGNGNFQYAKQGDAGSVNAEVSGKLDNTLSFGPDENKVSVLSENTNLKAKFTDNDFDNVEFNLHAHYDRKGDPFEGNGLLLDARLQSAKYEKASGTVSGSGTLKLRESTTIKSGDSTVTIKAEGSVLQGTLENNELSAFKGRVLFESNLKLGGKDVKISGNIAADYTKDAGFGGQVFAKLDEDVSIGEGDTTLVIKNTSNAKATFTSEGLKQLKFNLQAEFDQRGSAFEDGQHLQLDLRIGDATYEDDKISGTGGVKLRAPCKVKANQDGSSSVTLKSGALNGTVKDNLLTSMTGNVQFESEIKVKEGSVLKVNGGLNASYTSDGATSEVNGNINARVAEPCPIAEGSHLVTVLPDTSVSASLEKGEFKGVKFNLHADYVYSGGQSPLHLDVRLANGSYVPEQGFSGKGSVTVVDPYTVKLGESEGTLKAGSSVSADVENNQLKKAAGTFLFEATVKVAGRDVKIDGELKGDLDNTGAEPLFNATATARLAEPAEFEFGTNQFTLLPDTRVKASVVNNKFDELKFDLHAHTKHSGAPFSAAQPLQLDLQLKDVGFKDGEGFSGTGTLSLLDDCTISVGEHTIKLLQAGTQASGEVKGSELVSLKGQIAFESEVQVQGQTIKIGGTVAGGYDKAEGISGRAEAMIKETTAPIPMAGGTFVIFDDTQISAEVKGGEFDNMKFNLHAEYARTANPAIVVDLRANMDYSKTDGFSGQASAEIKSDEVELLRVGEYTLVLQQGTGAIVKLEKSELTHIGGTVNMMLKDGEGDFVKASVTANYLVKENQFSGTGSAEVVREKELGKVGSGENQLTLFVEQGTGATIDVQNNALQSIGGTVKVRADDSEGAFIRVTLAGSFDAAGGTGFSGSGSAEILHDKKLLAMGDYEFWIKTGSGAIVTLDKNALKEVGGTINFLVKNKDANGAILPFIEGSVTGTYKADEGKFSGSGDVKLARDVTFDISGDTKIKFLAGSGGGGTVKDNKLEKLTGTLKAMLVVKGQDYLKVEAGGEYDAINNKIVYLDGSAELLQPIKLFGDKVIISDLKGNARIEDNKLVRAGGSAKIDVPGVSGFNITGTVENFLWRNVGGQDLYSGAGSITIEKPGRVKGTVRGEIFEDGKFNVEGEVELVINQMLKGMIGLKMDQTFNPEIKGELEVKAELMKARDLFSFSQKLFDMNINVMAGPVPITIGAGAAFGFKVSTQPVVFEGKIGIEGFRPLEMNIPRFNAEAALKTGLLAKAELIPYVKVGLGIGGVLAAGLKLKGILSASAAADLGLSLKLQGDGNGVGGSVGVDLGLKISADLAVVPEVYCEVLSFEFSKQLASFNFALGDLFSWNWGTSFPFGNGPAVQAAPAAKTQPAAQKTVDASTAKESDPSGELQSKYGTANDPGPVPDGPTLPGPDQLKNETDASKKTDEKPADSKFDKMMQIAGKVGGVAGTASKLMSALSTAWTILTVGSMIPIPFGGPLAAGLYLVYLHISGKLTFGEVVKMFKDLFDIVKMLVAEGIITLPGWLKSIMDFFGQYDSISAGVKALITKAADWLRERFPSWTRVINAAERVFHGLVDVLAELIKAITGGGLSLKTMLSILGKLGSAVVELIGAVAEMIGEAVMAVVKEVGELLGSIGRGLVNLAGRALQAIGNGLRSVGRALTSW